MVDSYIATEDFSFLFKGDVITLDNDKYTLSKEDNYSDSNCVSHCSRSISLSKDLVEDYVKSGLLEPVTNNNDSSDKLTKITNLINQLKKKYDRRNEVVESKYKNGEIPTCVKVEHDTVYFNLTKLLNKIESIVNE